MPPPTPLHHKPSTKVFEDFDCFNCHSFDKFLQLSRFSSRKEVLCRATGTNWVVLCNGVIVQRLTSLKIVLQEPGLETLISFPVRNCPQVFGVSLMAAARRSDNVGELMSESNCLQPFEVSVSAEARRSDNVGEIVYSKDMRPSPPLIEESRGATILIHEVNLLKARFNCHYWCFNLSKLVLQ
ncbi:hypothetical protein RND81_14G183000 [Saponaria officinalis]|uniref:ribonuclease Z n=1 Tax=Saponaria officinalis TaxID=3572 RepID=A0AAW1GVA2_SAPOF